MDELRFSILSPEAYASELEDGCPIEDVRTENEKEGLRTKIFETRLNIVDAFALKWEVEDDFEVGSDFDFRYYLCGGVYSSRIVCRDYLLTIAATLSKTSSPSKWTFLTSCEVENGEGEFFVRDNTVFICSDSQTSMLSSLGVT